MTDKREQQRGAILQAAYDLVADVGVSGLRTRDIALRAGVNVATLHYCFAGKDALLRALFEFIKDKFKDAFQSRLDQAQTATEKLVAHAELRIRFLREQPVVVQVWRAFVGEAWTNPVIRAIVRRSQYEQRERMTALVAQGRASGEFTGLPSVDDAVVASLLMAQLEGMMTQYALDTEAFSLESFAGAIYHGLGLRLLPELTVEQGDIQSV